MNAKIINHNGADTAAKPSGAIKMPLIGSLKDGDAFWKIFKLALILVNKIPTYPEATPRIKQIVAKAPILKENKTEGSVACFTLSLLGRAKKVAPKTLTKHAKAKPPVNAKEPAAKTKINFIKLSVYAIPCNKD